MRILFQILALAGLILILIPSILFFYGNLAPEHMRTYMFLGTVLWFAGAIPWLGRKKKAT